MIGRLLRLLWLRRARRRADRLSAITIDLDCALARRAQRRRRNQARGRKAAATLHRKKMEGLKR